MGDLRHLLSPRRSASTRSSAELDLLYGKPYYSGESSGYASTGYSSDHPEWKTWLNLAARITPPPATLLDLGTAYGYLPREARSLGYRAFGTDISSYALVQETEFKGLLLRSNLHDLPFQTRSADIVIAMDVLEHLEDPVRALVEIARVMTPEGLFMAATPDPIYFDRIEKSHCSEYPPSFWIGTLEKLGFTVQFRFSEVPYNFQFLAARTQSEAALQLDLFQHDYFDTRPDFICCGRSKDLPVRAVPRSGWASLKNGSRAIKDNQAAIYLLNRTEKPLETTLRFKVQHTADFSTLRIRLDSYVLKDLQLGSERLEHQLEFHQVLLPSGGHHLFFDLFPGGPEVNIADFALEAEVATSAELAEGLPFDLFQRYKLAGEIVTRCSPSTILDIGGYIGDQDGHLAISSDLLGESESITVVTTDIRQADYPTHLPSQACEQPFKGKSFELVLSLDVLEHLPADERTRFFEELDRLASRWIILGAPFYTEEVERAEERLSQALELPFLAEHRQMGLPRIEIVYEFFQTARDYNVISIPSGYLPRWIEMQILTQLYFSFQDYQVTRNFNRLYNRCFYREDLRQPSYRTLFLISKQPLTKLQEQGIRNLVPGDSSAETCRSAFATDPAFEALIRRIRHALQETKSTITDLNFLLNSRQKLIQMLEKDKQELLRQLQETPLRKLAVRRWRKRRKE